MKLQELFEAVGDFDRAAQEGLDALADIRKGKAGKVYSKGEYSSADFEYSFNAEDGSKVDATINVSAGHFQGSKKPIVWHFEFKKMQLDGGKAKAFHPEADSGPIIANLNDLDSELELWEDIVAKNLKAKPSKSSQ